MANKSGLDGSSGKRLKKVNDQASQSEVKKRDDFASHPSDTAKGRLRNNLSSSLALVDQIPCVSWQTGLRTCYGRFYLISFFLGVDFEYETWSAISLSRDAKNKKRVKILKA